MNNGERILHEAGDGIGEGSEYRDRNYSQLLIIYKQAKADRIKCHWQKGKNPTNLEFYIPVILSFNTEGEIKTFPDREKLRGFTSRIPALKETVEDVGLQKEENSGLHTGRVSKEWMKEGNIKSVIFLTLSLLGDYSI